jgi:acetoin:2,6-dichlorophenolindophenol oxidoreductase subunit beta
MTEMTFAEALALGLTECLDRDARVVLINAFFGGFTRHRIPYDIIRQRYADRVTETPISELGFCGIAVGAAMTGLRPIVALATGAFSFEAWPQIVNEAAIACYGSGGRVTAPVVFHMLTGIRGAGGVQHSHAPQSMFCNAPGLQVVAPATPADARGLMKTAALYSSNPTVYIDHSRLQGFKGPVDTAVDAIPFGIADVKRQGSDVTIVAVSVMLPRALEAADALARERISAEVVDPRTLVPLDRATIIRSVAKTGRVVVADESPVTCGITAELAAVVAEAGFDSLKAPIRRVGIPNVPIPYHAAEEDFVTPTAAKIIAAARDICRK